MSHVHDPGLLDALEALNPEPIDTLVWRVTWATRNPLAGGSGGGRWHPPNDFEALYTSLDPDVALAEIYHHLSMAPVISSSHVKISTLKVKAERVLVFPDIASLSPLGVDPEGFRHRDCVGVREIKSAARGVLMGGDGASSGGRTREIGSAARLLDMAGLVVPSARWPGANLVLFVDRLGDHDTLSVVKTQDVNWPAWKERTRDVDVRPDRR